ncbi:LolA family protein [Desulfogranum marinum]|uniref:LolA family protein n=1 Tax=Desulfogranum marinum TaxID=453220 RepID=UPI001964B5B0|nr:outer membrane lipoprotein carrier protein LolA [Desulfogranum marinum]MBM9513733.1 outer membrane lipoprotein carrier protein LolA [Desulfogranum marinum]
MLNQQYPLTKFFLLCLLLTCTTFFLSLPVKATTGEEQVKKIQARYNSITSICFDFHQQTTTSGRVRSGNGNAVFVKTSSSADTIMRWNYVAPTEQIILNTGDKLSIYTKDDKQLLITKMDQLNADITLTLFSGKADILDTFQVVPQQNGGNSISAGNNLQTLQLTPTKPHSQLQRLQIWYAPDNLIHKLAMEDHFGSVTTILFTSIRLNTIKPDDTVQIQQIVHMDLPKDTEVIHQ